MFGYLLGILLIRAGGQQDPFDQGMKFIRAFCYHVISFVASGQ